MTVDEDFSNSYTEVLEIIEHLSDDNYKKIPKELIEKLQRNRNPNYKTNLRYDIPLENQKMLYKTRIIIKIIFCNFLANENEKKQYILEKQKCFNNMF